jgi:DNA-binding transcriptional LysR family regulator
MSRRAPDWDLLASFLDVAEAGGLSAAARAGAGSQPTLGRRIEALEAALGVPLFERTARGLKLTDAGAGVAAHARAMREEAVAAADLAARGAEALSGAVRITASRVMSAFLLPPIVARLRATHPEIAIELNASDAIENLLEHDADIAVRLARPEQATLVGRKVGAMAVGAYAHRDYLKRRGTPQTVADLAHHDLIGEDQGTLIRSALKSLGAPLGREAFAVRCDDGLVQWQAICAGAGIGAIATFVGDAGRADGVERVLAHIPAPPLPVWLAARREVRSLRRVRVVFDALAAGVHAALA